MNRGQFAAIAVLLLATGGNPSKPHSMFDSELARLARAHKLTVYHVSDLLNTALTPEQVRTFYGVRTFEISSGPEIAAAIDAVKRSGPALVTTPGDARWLLDFTDPSGDVGTVSCDKLGKRGTIDSTAVSFANNALLDWLHALSA
ncbi:MAG: hypothetical protein ACXWNK_15345 [Vulcanimicrobiaceae bacterium]